MTEFEPLQVWINTTIMLAGFTAVGTIIWRISQKFSTTENKLADHEKQISSIDKRIEVYRLEQKESLIDDRGNINNQMVNIRTDHAKEIESSKLEHKDIYAKVAEVNEQVTANRIIQEFTHEEVKNNYAFFINWIQRLEDMLYDRCSPRNRAAYKKFG